MGLWPIGRSVAPSANPTNDRRQPTPSIHRHRPPPTNTTTVGVKVVVRVRRLLDHELAADGDSDPAAATAQQQQEVSKWLAMGFDLWRKSPEPPSIVLNAHRAYRATPYPYSLH